MKITKKYCQQLDKEDPLAFLRKEFHYAKGKINLDGNSLGSMPKAAKNRLKNLLQKEWGEGLIDSWWEAGWFDLPTIIGNKIAPLLGATSGEVIVGDSTSINLHKALATAIQFNKKRSVLLAEKGSFSTDLYIMQGLSTFSNGSLKTKIVKPKNLLKSFNSEVAAIVLTQVNYKTAALKNIKKITQKAQAAGILVIWDLSHSIGTIELNLNEANVDFAVGCGYKFLNGGPGAPAFLFVAKRHQKAAFSILSGWLGHRAPFDFKEKYQPAKGISRFRCGTPSILSMAALECGVDLFSKTTVTAVRKKSLHLSRLFIHLMAQECANYGFELASPMADKKRGGHVAYRHPNGQVIHQALKEAGIIADFRTPDILRFGMAAMYLRYIDIYKAVQLIKKIGKKL